MSSPLARGQPGAMAPPPPNAAAAKKRGGGGKRKELDLNALEFTKPPTLCITHTQCLKHYVRDKNHPEQPARVASVVASLRDLLNEQYTSQEGDGAFPFHMMEMSSSPAMLSMLEAQLSELTQPSKTPGGTPAARIGLPHLTRTDSVDYLANLG